jgi:hypothetical protein
VDRPVTQDAMRALHGLPPLYSPARRTELGTPLRGRRLLALLQAMGAVTFEPVRDHAVYLRDRVLNEDGSVAYEGTLAMPNALTNDGQASNLNVWLRGSAAPAMYGALLNMPGAGAPQKAQVMTIAGSPPTGGFIESNTPGSGGYNRVQWNTNTTDWPNAPALNSGDMQITSIQKTFGPFTGNTSITHLSFVTVASGNAGLVLLYVSGSYYAANAAAQVLASGQSYQVSLSDKVT